MRLSRRTFCYKYIFARVSAEHNMMVFLVKSRATIYIDLNNRKRRGFFVEGLEAQER